MPMNDPLGDMIARIYNAQMRNKSKVSIPTSRLRVSVLDVLKAEGFIRGYTAVEHSNGRKELEVELKYFDGEPVIREISRVSKPGRPSRFGHARNLADHRLAIEVFQLDFEFLAPVRMLDRRVAANEPLGFEHVEDAHPQS